MRSLIASAAPHPSETSTALAVGRQSRLAARRPEEAGRRRPVGSCACHVRTLITLCCDWRPIPTATLLSLPPRLSRLQHCMQADGLHLRETACCALATRLGTEVDGPAGRATYDKRESAKLRVERPCLSLNEATDLEARSSAGRRSGPLVSSSRRHPGAEHELAIAL